MASNVQTVPLLPLRGMIVFPYMIVHLDVGRDKSVAALEKAMLDERKIFLVAQKDPDEENPNNDSLYKVGTFSEIRQLIKIPGDGGLRVLVEGMQRGVIKEFIDEDDYTSVEVELYEDKIDESKQMEALTRGVVRQFEEWVRLSRKIPPETLVSVALLDDAGRLADLIASHLNIKLDIKQEILDCIDVKDRLEKLYEVLIRELDILAIESKIGLNVRKQMEKLQKDHYLREQIKAIRKELGEDFDAEAVADEYRSRLNEGNYPNYVQEAIEKELRRLDDLNSFSAETAVIRKYVETVLDLPWEIESEDSDDIARAKQILNNDHYALDKVKDRILDFIAVNILAKDKNAPILCLVGPPGVGKTSLASSIANAIGRKFVRASLGGVRDEAEIRGHRRTYVGAMPGRIIEGISKAKVKNPVFLLDEVDKMDSGYNGDPSAALLEVLDPAQNNTFSDHYIDLPFDLSKIIWIVTANNEANIPRALRDRMEIINISGYTDEEKLQIAKRHLFARQREQNGLLAKNISLGKGVIEKIIEEYTRESGVRELERMIGKVCRKVARKIVEDGVTKVSVTKKNLTEFLDKPKAPHFTLQKKPQVGLATGMAWTELGGVLLPTEAIVLPGKGNLILTGKLGEVMQESAQAGFTYIRSRAKKLKIAANFYEKHDIHIHLPEGAVPKDGPSAGITMASAMISALTNRKLRTDVAMTGEITIRGNVLPIGGLKEKVLAAYRDNIKTIILPKKNEIDIVDIPSEIRDDIEFIPVETMDDVLSVVLI